MPPSPPWPPKGPPASLGVPAFAPGPPSPFWAVPLPPLTCAWFRGTHSVLGPLFPPRGVVESETSDIGTAFRGALHVDESLAPRSQRRTKDRVFSSHQQRRMSDNCGFLLEQVLTHPQAHR